MRISLPYNFIAAVLKPYSERCRFTKICYNEDEEPLKEYAWLVDAVRRHQSEKMDLDAAVDAALDEMPNKYMTQTSHIDFSYAP